MPVGILLNGPTVNSRSTINVLGVLFDAKLQWSQYIATAINKAKTALHGRGMIRKLFTNNKLLNILTYNYYYILRGSGMV